MLAADKSFLESEKYYLNYLTNVSYRIFRCSINYILIIYWLYISRILVIYQVLLSTATLFDEKHLII